MQLSRFLQNTVLSAIAVKLLRRMRSSSTTLAATTTAKWRKHSGTWRYQRRNQTKNVRIELQWQVCTMKLLPSWRAGGGAAPPSAAAPPALVPFHAQGPEQGSEAPGAPSAAALCPSSLEGFGTLLGVTCLASYISSNHRIPGGLLRKGGAVVADEEGTRRAEEHPSSRRQP